MNRRGFFASLFEETPKTVFLGVQVVYSTLRQDDSATRLRSVIAEALAHQRYDTLSRSHEKRAVYKRLTTILLEQQPFWEYGYWDCIAHDHDAHTEFETWLGELQAAMATEPEELGSTVDELHRLSSDKSYVVVTFCVVFAYTPSVQTALKTIEQFDDEEPYTKATFTTLLTTLNTLDFEHCERDAVFVLPGTAEDGFSWEDLHSEGWHYLKPISW